MKKSLSSTLPILLLCAILLASCGAAPQADAAAKVQPDAAAADTEPAAEIIPTAEPTETPEPIPCNVVFDSDRDGNREIYIMGPDGENPTNLSNSPTDDWDPAISPDGSQIAFVSFRENENGGDKYIYVMDADGSNLRQLTFEASCDFPDWSHDGKMITYASNDDIYIISADGSGSSIRLTDSPEKDVLPTWSPDGSQIAWLSGQGDAANIFVMDANGQNVRQITDNGKIHRVEWTVDGRIFTGSWGWNDKEEFCHNCVVTADGANIEDAGGKGEVQRFLPFWNGSGDQVELVEGSLDDGPSEIYLVGEVFPDIFYNMTNNPAWDSHPDWPANCGPDFVQTAQSEPSKQAEPAGEAPPAAGQDFVIGYEGEPTGQKLADLKQACDELGLQCVQAESIAALAEQGVDAIISFSNIWDVNGSWPEIHEAASKGFPIYILDGETGEPGVYNLAVESGWVHASLQWMFAQMGGAGEMVYFNFGPNDFYENIIQQELESNPGIQATSIPASYDDMSVASQEKILEMLASNPDLGAIWADEMREEIFWAVNGLQDDQYPVILCSARQDILQGWKELITEHPAFNCFMAIKPGGNAYEAVYVAYYRLTGLELDPAALGGDFGNTLQYDYPQITNDNLDEWLGKIGDLRRNQQGETLELPPMTPEEIKAKWFLE